MMNVSSPVPPEDDPVKKWFDPKTKVSWLTLEGRAALATRPSATSWGLFWTCGYTQFERWLRVEWYFDGRLEIINEVSIIIRREHFIFDE